MPEDLFSPDNRLRTVKWKDLRRRSECAVTLGNFDGVHIGHRKILEKTVSLAEQLGLEPVVITFFPHPRYFLGKSGDFSLINTPWEKVSLIKCIYPFHIHVLEFDRALASLSPESFIDDLLLDRLKASAIVLGPDTRFGAGAQGTISLLRKRLGERCDNVVEVPAVEIEGEKASSTLIRRLLGQGHIEKANRFLGYPHFFSGTVVRGDGRGRQLGFPTANLETGFDRKIAVREGVYGGMVRIGEKKLNAVINIGKSPTFKTQNTKIEAHILDFQRDIYGQKITMELDSYIRNEAAFNSVQELVQQIRKDVAGYRIRLKSDKQEKE